MRCPSRRCRIAAPFAGCDHVGDACWFGFTDDRAVVRTDTRFVGDAAASGLDVAGVFVQKRSRVVTCQQGFGDNVSVAEPAAALAHRAVHRKSVHACEQGTPCGFVEPDELGIGAVE